MSLVFRTDFFLCLLFPKNQSNKDTESIEGEQWNGEEALGNRIRWSEDGCDNKNHKHGILEILYHPFCSDDFHAGKEESQRREFENYGNTQMDAQDQTKVLVHCNHSIEFRTRVQKEPDSPGKDNTSKHYIEPSYQHKNSISIY